MELVKIDDQQFGDLIKLPDIYKNSSARLQKARDYATLQLSAVKLVDMDSADIAFVEKLFEPVVELRSLLAEARKEIEADRKPLTQKMDAVKSALTAIEKGFDEEIAAVADLQNKWEIKKVERKQKAEKAKEAEIKKAQERIELALRAKNAYAANFNSILLDELSRLSEKFYTKTAEELPEFASALRFYMPELDSDQTNRITSIYVDFKKELLSESEAEKILTEQWNAVFPSIEEEYRSKVGEALLRFADLVPSRIQEINEGNTKAAEARIANEQKETERLLNEALSDKTEAAQLSAETEKLSTHFVESAAPVITKAKGAVTKRKYVPETHKAFASLLQSWVKNDMPNLTLAELGKKLSFVVTAGNTRLNAKTSPETIVAEGLKVVEEIQTRTQNV